jgi:hypothetical protein
MERLTSELTSIQRYALNLFESVLKDESSEEQGDRSTEKRKWEEVHFIEWRNEEELRVGFDEDLLLTYEWHMNRGFIDDLGGYLSRGGTERPSLQNAKS